LVTYMVNPSVQFIVGAEDLSAKFDSADIIRIENGFDTATVTMSDVASTKYPASVAAGKTITLGVKAASDGAYTTVLNGLIRFCTPILSKLGEYLILKCDGTGYGFGESACNQQYGTESTHSTLDTIAEILNDPNYGVIPKHVNMILGSGASGYAYDFANIDAIAGEGVIPFYQSPFKPCLAVVNDLCDLVSAQTADANNGPHWIVDTDGNFRLKQLKATQAGWTRYYGNSQANSLLVQGVDFEDYGFEHADSEANYVLFYGVLRKPAQDYWTDGHAALWGHNANMNQLSDDAVLFKVGANSLRLYNAGGADGQAYWPSGLTAAWDFTKIGSEQNPPAFNFYNYYDTGTGNIMIGLYTDGSNYYYKFIPDTDKGKWIYYSKRVGPYYRPGIDWDMQGAPSWSNINYVLVWHPLTLMVSNWDDMHFEGLICRAARDATLIGTDKLKLKSIIDSVGKDDTMKSGTLGTSDIGTMGQLVHSELRRARTKPLTGTVTVPMIKDALPGQTFHIHAKTQASGVAWSIDKDMRAITIKHTIRTSGLWTQLTLTDDFLNSRPRQPYAQLNSLLAAVRPEYQDRQATNIKAASVDIRVPILLENYPS
jgi:hypothetical protein